MKRVNFKHAKKVLTSKKILTPLLIIGITLITGGIVAAIASNNQNKLKVSNVTFTNTDNKAQKTQNPQTQSNPANNSNLSNDKTSNNTNISTNTSTNNTNTNTPINPTAPISTDPTPTPVTSVPPAPTCDTTAQAQDVTAFVNAYRVDLDNASQQISYLQAHNATQAQIMAVENTFNTQWNNLKIQWGNEMYSINCTTPPPYETGLQFNTPL